MKNNKWYAAAVGLVALMALSGTASAHDMDKKDGARHHHKMCEAGMKPSFMKDKADFKKMHALHEKMHAVLVAQKFDKKAFLSLSSQMGQIRSQMERRHAEAFANRAAKMSPEERIKMAERFHGHEQAHEHGEGGWHHHIEWHGAHSHNNQTHDWDRPTN
jgi:hypothetical protein